MTSLATAPLVCSIEREVRDLPLHFDAPLPGWLDGSLLRTGPGVFELPADRVDHFFDGLGVVFSVTFCGRRQPPRFSLKVLKSTQAQESLESGRFEQLRFGRPRRGLAALGRFARLLSSGRPGGGFENACINILTLGNRWAVLGESNKVICFDPDTLDTTSVALVEGVPSRRLSMLTPHPAVCPANGHTYNLSYIFNRYRFVRYRALLEVEPVAEFRPPKNFYAHSIAATANHLIALNGAKTFELHRALIPTAPLADAIATSLEKMSIFLCDLRTNEIFDVPAKGIHAMHIANAYEEDHHVIIDTVEYRLIDQSPYDVFKLTPIQASPGSRGQSYRLANIDMSTRLVRRVLDPRRRVLLEERELGVDSLEFPQVAPWKQGLRHRYVYYVKGVEPNAVLAKFDTERNIETIWEHPGYAGEPILVSHTAAGGDEDDCVLISFVKSSDGSQTSCALVDGKTMKLLSRAQLPINLPWPPGFHGTWRPARASSSYDPQAISTAVFDQPGPEHPR